MTNLAKISKDDILKIEWSDSICVLTNEGIEYSFTVEDVLNWIGVYDYTVTQYPDGYYQMGKWIDPKPIRVELSAEDYFEEHYGDNQLIEYLNANQENIYCHEV